MSENWVQDIKDMHDKFGVNPVVRSFDADKLKKYLRFRVDFLQEELDEIKSYLNTDVTGTPREDVTDGLIDLCVVAIGTLNAFDIDAYEAWDRVHNANMQKQAGIKPGRPNPLGLPDLMKPAGWVSPTHADNIGLLSKIPESDMVKLL